MLPCNPRTKPDKPKKPRVQREKVLVREPITQFLRWHGWRVFTTDVIRVGQSNRGAVNQGETGQPDLVAIRTAGGYRDHLLIETKAAKGKLSPEQEQWHFLATKDGENVLVPYSFEEFEKWYAVAYPGEVSGA